MKGFLAEAELVAPLVCQVLRQIGIQTTMCMYFLACGTSRSLFDVLNHAGISLSYTQAILKLKKLGEERLQMTRKIARTRPFMLIWDNLNIAFKVSEQRQDSKDRLDNETTATLVPLYDVEYGTLPTTMKPRRTLSRPVLDIQPEDLVPSCEEALRVQESQIWHIADILYDAFPDLRHRLGDKILPPPSVMQIPVHTIEPYPLPSMHIDESSLEGTLQVFDTILRKSNSRRRISGSMGSFCVLVTNCRCRFSTRYVIPRFEFGRTVLK